MIYSRGFGKYTRPYVHRLGARFAPCRHVTDCEGWHSLFSHLTYARSACIEVLVSMSLHIKVLVSMSLRIGVLVSMSSYSFDSWYRCHIARGSLGIDVMLRFQVLAQAGLPVLSQFFSFSCDLTFLRLIADAFNYLLQPFVQSVGITPRLWEFLRSPTRCILTWHSAHLQHN